MNKNLEITTLITAELFTLIHVSDIGKFNFPGHFDIIKLFRQRFFAHGNSHKSFERIPKKMKKIFKIVMGFSNQMVLSRRFLTCIFLMTQENAN